MIICKDLSLGYGEKHVLEGFHCEIRRGTIAAILGGNGVGKSTLLAAMAGDLTPRSGEITIDGNSIHALSRAELSLLRAMAKQSSTYWMAFSAREILLLGHDSVATERLNYLIEKLSLQSFLDQSITTLSGGQLQRIEIARSLMREVPLVLLDEPFASQDLKSTTAITELLMSEREQGRTIVLVAHKSADDLQWCDQVIDLGSR